MAANIDEAIRDCDNDITRISENAIRSLFSEMTQWIQELFTDVLPVPAVFPEAVEPNANQRTVRDWVAPSFLALDMIEGPGNLDSTSFSTSSVIDTVFRTLTAVKFATLAGRITSAQETSVVTIYTARWE